MGKVVGERKRLELPALRLDAANPRLPVDAADHNEVMAKLLERFQPEIVELAENIEKGGLDGGDLPVVGPWTEVVNGKTRTVHNVYRVYDGNRRLTAIRLLEDPKAFKGVLSPSNAKRIAKLHGREGREPFTHLECLVVLDEDEALRIVNRRHSGSQNGIGRLEWGSFEKGRFSSRIDPENAPLHFKIFLAVKNGGLLSKDVEEAIVAGKGWISTFDRIVKYRVARPILGFELKNGEFTFTDDKTKVLARLASLIERLAKGIIDVESFRTEPQVKHAVQWEVENIGSTSPNPHRRQSRSSGDNSDSGTQASNTKTGAEATAQGSAAATTSNSSAGGAKPAASTANSTSGNSTESASKSSSTTKKMKPLRSVAPAIEAKPSPRRAADLVRELQELDAQRFANCGTISLRAVVEYTLRQYTKAFSLNVKSSDAAGPTLSNFFEVVHNSLSKSADKETNQRLNTKKPAATTAIKSMNGFVHDPETLPTESSLRHLWDDLDAHLCACWEAIARRGES